MQCARVLQAAIVVSHSRKVAGRRVVALKEVGLGSEAPR